MVVTCEKFFCQHCLSDLASDSRSLLLQGKAILSEFGEAEGRRGEGQHAGARSKLPRAGNGETHRVLCHAADSCIQPQSKSTGK